MAQPTVVVGGTVSGNVGSCSVQTSDIQVDLFHVRSIGVNSCSGGIVGDYTHVDGNIFFVVPILLFFCVFALGIAIGVVYGIFHKY